MSADGLWNLEYMFFHRHLSVVQSIEKNKWILEEYKAPDDTIKIKSINVSVNRKFSVRSRGSWV